MIICTTLGSWGCEEPTGEATIIAAGACYETVKYPNSYNVVRLDFESGQGTIHLRVFSKNDGGFWTRDTQRYAKAQDGSFTFPLPDDLKRLGSNTGGPGEAIKDETSGDLSEVMPDPAIPGGQ